MEDVQQVSCHCHCHCHPIDSLSVWERMWYPPSGESPQPKLSLDDFFDCRLRLTEVLHNNSYSRKRKLFKEIGESLPQNVRRTTRSEFVFAWKVASFEVDTSLFDLKQWINCRSEYDGYFSVNYFVVKAFEKKNLTTNLCSDFSIWRNDAALMSCRS
jgi:hypothetical protein